MFNACLTEMYKLHLATELRPRMERSRALMQHSWRVDVKGVEECVMQHSKDEANDNKDVVLNFT